VRFSCKAGGTFSGVGWTQVIESIESHKIRKVVPRVAAYAKIRVNVVRVKHIKEGDRGERTPLKRGEALEVRSFNGCRLGKGWHCSNEEQGGGLEKT